MKKKSLLIAVFTLCLFGCSTTNYTHKTNNCSIESDKVVCTNGIVVNYQNAQKVETDNNCVTVWGENVIFTICK